MNRRNLIRSLAFTPMLLSFPAIDLRENKTKNTSRLQYSVNAYTFNSQLRSGEMTFFDMMEFAADLGLDAVDLTGYYFPSYPGKPTDKELFQLKKKALNLGLNISWTGVRNDFANPDVKAREADREMIKQWLQTSSKLGASIMRIFAGTNKHEGFSRSEVKDWMVEEFKKCADYAKETGVLAGLQHHNDFLYTADEVIDILKRVNSDWFGLILDIGSLRTGDPYNEISKLAPFANYWFIKEYVYHDGVATNVNMKKIAGILKRESYQGYISFESLGDGDPKEIVSRMFNDFKTEYDLL